MQIQIRRRDEKEDTGTSDIHISLRHPLDDGISRRPWIPVPEIVEPPQLLAGVGCSGRQEKAEEEAKDTEAWGFGGVPATRRRRHGFRPGISGRPSSAKGPGHVSGMRPWDASRIVEPMRFLNRSER